VCEGLCVWLWSHTCVTAHFEGKGYAPHPLAPPSQDTHAMRTRHSRAHTCDVGAQRLDGQRGVVAGCRLRTLLQAAEPTAATAAVAAAAAEAAAAVATAQQQPAPTTPAWQQARAAEVCNAQPPHTCATGRWPAHANTHSPTLSHMRAREHQRTSWILVSFSCCSASCRRADSDCGQHTGAHTRTKGAAPSCRWEGGWVRRPCCAQKGGGGCGTHIGGCLGVWWARQCGAHNTHHTATASATHVCPPALRLQLPLQLPDTA
jgi:hypothetical protein